MCLPLCHGSQGSWSAVWAFDGHGMLIAGARQLRGARILQVYILPTIRINDGQYRGKLSYTEVLRAIVEARQLRQEAAAALEDMRRGFQPDHMLVRKAQKLFDDQFGGG